MTTDKDLNAALAEQALKYLRSAENHRLLAGRAKTGRDAQAHMIASGIAIDKARMLAEKFPLAKDRPNRDELVQKLKRTVAQRRAEDAT